MKVLLSSRAEHELKKISKTDQIIIIHNIRSFNTEDFRQKEERLVGYKNVYRIRVGDYRIVYRRLKDEIFITLIAHRKDVYRLLSRLFN